MKLNKLIIYKKLSQSVILKNIDMLITSALKNNKTDLEANQTTIYDCISQLLEIANTFGFEGNLWKTYIAYLLINDENIYSKSSEMIGNIDGSINDLVTSDFKILREYYNYDLSKLIDTFGIESIALIDNYIPVEHSKKMFNMHIRGRICDLVQKLDEAKSEIGFKNTITNFYKEYGVGKIGLHKAFRINDNTGEIIPISNIATVSIDDLVGYDIPKKQLLDNTKAFVEGRKANNCLLYGDAGTGKSTCIKAIVNQFYEQGLRIIEVYKHQFKYLNDIISEIKNRNYRFIIYLDDLSFEEFEIEYKYLKAIIEGSLEKKPNNVLIYATSNRRHLIKETFDDRQGLELGSREINTTESMQEKMSLASRFGESIFFGVPTRVEFLEIVKTLAKRNNINMDEEELCFKANQWELYHADQSGRTAQQFIDHLLATS